MGRKPAHVHGRITLTFASFVLNIVMNEQKPLWISQENENVLDSSTPIMESPGARIKGYDSNGIPREGRVLSKFVAEGKQYAAIQTDDGVVCTVQTASVLLG